MFTTEGAENTARHSRNQTEYPISRPALRDPARRENIQYPTEEVKNLSKKTRK